MIEDGLQLRFEMAGLIHQQLIRERINSCIVAALEQAKCKASGRAIEASSDHLVLDSLADQRIKSIAAQVIHPWSWTWIRIEPVVGQFMQEIERA